MSTDAHIVQAVLAGDSERFAELVDRYRDAVYGVALSKTGAIADAEDLAQETFVAAFGDLRKLRDPARFGSWLYGIALNKARRFLRDRAATPEPAERAQWVGSPDASSPEASASSREMAAIVRRALGRLSDRNRETATLFYINGYSCQDISRFTDVPVGTIKRRLHDARAQLRKELVNMVETGLKKSRPGDEFTQRVLARISKVRVGLARDSGFFVLIDEKQRALPIVVGEEEARALDMGLTQTKSPPVPSAYDAIVQILGELGRKIEQVAVSDLRVQTFYGTVYVAGPKGVEEIDARPSDALNFAVRAGAPIFVHADVMESAIMKTKKGAPKSPAETWRAMSQHVQKPQRSSGSKGGQGREIKRLQRLLKKHPRSAKYRLELAWAYVGTRPDEERRFGRLRWSEADRVLGELLDLRTSTKYEAAARGLLGGIRLARATLASARGNQEEAMELLCRAHELKPEDSLIQFDLATAYARTGRRAEALELMKEISKADESSELLHYARECANFESLWRTKRFRELFGRPNVRAKLYLRSAHLQLTFVLDVAQSRKGEAEDDTTRCFREPRAADLRRVSSALGLSDLIAIREVRATDEKATGYALWDAKGREIVLAKNFAILACALRQTRIPRPMTAHLAYEILKAANVKVDAAVLTHRRRGRVVGALVAHRGRKRVAAPLDGMAALGIAVCADCPVLIGGTLAAKATGKR